MHPLNYNKFIVVAILDKLEKGKRKMKNNILAKDYMRYSSKSDMPAFQKYFRKVQSTKFVPLVFIYKVLFRITKELRHIEIPRTTNIGEGLYIGHAYNITINPKAVLGKNINIHRGVLIGQTNRGVNREFRLLEMMCGLASML